MNSIRDVFLKTLKLGESIFSLHYTDYEDAFSYSEKYYSVHTDHLLDFFRNHTSMDPSEYEEDLIRYIFIKAVEHIVSTKLFANTSRGNVCDVFYSPFDISLQKYPTNLPLFLEYAVNAHQEEAIHYTREIMALQSRDKKYTLNRGLLNAVMFVGMTTGHSLGVINSIHKGYKTSDMLTRNEINQWAVHNMSNWFSGNGYKIECTNHTRDTAQNIIMSKGGTAYNVLVAAEIAPVSPGFLKEDMDAFYKAATDCGAIPLAASINLGSANRKHFNDSVILYGDQIMYQILSVIKVEPEKQ